MTDKLKQLYDFGIVPVVTINDENKAVPVAKALATGELPCAEVTFRTEAAAQSIKNIRTSVPDMLVGAGTVLTTKQVDEALEAGAQFIVSPCFDLEIIDYCNEKGVLIIPGCQTASEVAKASKHGLKAVKFFPAEAAGGVKMIQSLASVFPEMKFMPTGGVKLDNLNDYLDEANVMCCGGSWLTPAKLIDEENYDAITALAKEAVAKMLGFKTVHVGINCQDRAEASEMADKFEALFGFKKVEYGMSFLSATSMEEMKSPYLGENGHVAFAANYPVRAVAYLERKGVTFDESTSVFDDIGLKAIYMDGEIGKFAYHLVRTPK